MTLITSADPTQILAILNQAKESGDCIRITQHYYGT